MHNANTMHVHKTGYTNTKCNAYCYTCGQYGHLRMQCPRELCCICGGNHTKKYCPIKVYDSLERLRKTLIYGIIRDPKETPIEVPKKSDNETWWRRVDPSDRDATKSHDNTYSISHEIDYEFCRSSAAETPLQVCHPVNINVTAKSVQDVINEYVDKLFTIRCKASLVGNTYKFSDIANGEVHIPQNYQPLVGSDGLTTIHATPVNAETVQFLSNNKKDEYNKQLEYLGLQNTCLRIDSAPFTVNKDLYNYIMNESAYWTRDHTLNDISIPMKYSCVCQYKRNTENSSITVEQNNNYEFQKLEVERKEPTGTVTLHQNVHNVNNIKYKTVPRSDFWLHFPYVESHYCMRREELSIRLKNICRMIASVKDTRRIPLGEKLYIAYTLDQVRRGIMTGDSSTLVELTQHCEDLSGNIIVPVAPCLKEIVNIHKLTTKLLEDTKRITQQKKDVAKQNLANERKQRRNNKKRIAKEYKKQKHIAQDITRKAIGTIKHKIKTLDQLGYVNTQIKNKLIKPTFGSKYYQRQQRKQNQKILREGRKLAETIVNQNVRSNRDSHYQKQYDNEQFYLDDRDLN